MARFFHSSRGFYRTLFPANPCQRLSVHPDRPISDISRFTRSHVSQAAKASKKSPTESNILRILSKEIDYLSEYAPPHQPVTRFHSFTVEDRPGEQWITLRGKHAEEENIKIEATMFDGAISVPKSGADSTGEDMRLHISLLVDIWKGEGGDSIEFLCSAWPESLEIQKVYMFRRDYSPERPYMGPDVRDLDRKLQSALYEFLNTRGVNDGLSRFLHEYITNKDRIELVKWLTKVKSFVEK